MLRCQFIVTNERENYLTINEFLNQEDTQLNLCFVLDVVSFKLPVNDISGIPNHKHSNTVIKLERNVNGLSMLLKKHLRN